MIENGRIFYDENVAYNIGSERNVKFDDNFYSKDVL